jgi:DNA-directed RNA polymerase subunit RPC12/RpoP
VRVDEVITCIDCGGQAHLLTTWPSDDPPEPGDVMSYRCADCNDRWDLVLPDEEDE